MKKVLVVDDEPAITRLVKLNLEATGAYEVLTENKASNAVSAARTFAPDLMLLDVMMPDMLGSDVAAAFNDDPALRHIKIVFLTAMLKKSEESTTGERGGKPRMLAKPITAAALVAAIEDELR